MAFNGKNQYTGQEVSNISMGQSGWVHAVTANDTYIAGSDHPDPASPVATDNYYPKVTHWVGIKVLAEGVASNADTSQAELTIELADGAQCELEPGQTSMEITLRGGESIFGQFKSVKPTALTAAKLIIFKG